MFRVQCPRCRAAWPSEAVPGTSIACPVCGQTLRLPGTPPADAVTHAAPPAAAAPQVEMLEEVEELPAIPEPPIPMVQALPEVMPADEPHPHRSRPRRPRGKRRTFSLDDDESPSYFGAFFTSRRIMGIILVLTGLVAGIIGLSRLEFVKGPYQTGVAWGICGFALSSILTGIYYILFEG